MKKEETELVPFAKRIFLAYQLLEIEKKPERKEARNIRIDMILKPSGIDYHGICPIQSFDEYVFRLSKNALNYAPGNIPNQISFHYLDAYHIPLERTINS